MTSQGKLLLVGFLVAAVAGGWWLSEHVALFESVEQTGERQASSEEHAPKESAQAAVETRADPVVRPTFDIVLVEPSGEVLAAGRAARRAEVELLLNGAPFGSDNANADGEWAVQPTEPAPAGRHTLEVRASGENGLGGPFDGERLTIEVSETRERPWSTATVSRERAMPAGEGYRADPDAAEDDFPPSPSIFIGGVSVDAPGRIRVAGRTVPGSTVRVGLNGGRLGQARADQDGDWTVLGERVLTPGRHVVRADLVNTAGRVLASAELQFDRLELVAGEADGIQPPHSHQLAIEPGDNLWNIARSIYGRGDRYRLIYESNRDEIANPALIYPGQVLNVPVPEEQAE